MTCTKKNITHIAVLLLLFFSGGTYAQITGHLVVCRGASRTTLTGTPSGGIWASGDATRATVNSTTGEVTGVAAGTATISYTDPSSTVYTAVVTVNGYVMGNIGFSMGSDIRCTGGVPAICTVSPLIGNNWTSSDPSIATINTGGSVVPSATNAGTVTISYRHSYGNCYVTRSMTVNPTPTVSMTNPVCAGVTQTATGTPSGGTWMSSNASVGTINTTTGVLSAFIGGGTYIRYTVGSCYSQPFLTVSAGVAAFGGSTALCVGNTSTLTCATSGGSWSSSDPSVATIGSSTGVVTGVTIGTSTISYVVGSSCFRTAVVTVNAGPSTSAGPDEVCVGQTIALTNATGGGTWSSSSTARATVTTYGGTVTGVGAGTVNISYRVGGGCATVKTITVNAAMASITGGPNVCEGTSVTLTHAMGAGTWTASNSHATVDLTTGVMTGITAGSVNITYTASPGCKKAQMMIVKSSPAAITGELTVCPGTTTALSSASGGGTWSSSNTSVATVNSTGVVTGVSGGTATITYTVASWGCSATAVVTVSSSGGSISGSTSLCLGSSTTLSSSAGGGTWSSSNTSVATIGSSSGVVTSVSTGTTVISYNTGSSCNSAVVVTVSEAPSAITGATGICSGSTTTLSNSISGGSWRSGNTSVATVNSSTGVVSGIAAGTATITYAIGSCSVTTVVTVTASPSAITGTLSLCEGSSTTLGNTAGGGVWSSGDPSVATISASTGVATGVAAGTAAITYTIGTCSVTTVLTVNAASAEISGGTTLFPSLTTVLSASVPGGSWSSSNVSIATVGSSTGIVTAVASGSATITYSLGSCLSVTTELTVLSDPAPITGGLGLEVGDGDTLANAVEGGVWSSSNTAVATIGSSSGILTAVGVGTTTISYTVGGTYLATVVVTVTSLTTSSSCPGGWTTLSGIPFINHVGYEQDAQMALDACGTPYVLSSSSSSRSYLSKYNGREFVSMGGAVDTPGVVGKAMSVNADGVAYVVYSDALNSNKATVKRNNAGIWETVGIAGFSSGAIYNPAIGINADGEPYVAFSNSLGASYITVMKYNGTSWEAVGDMSYYSVYINSVDIQFDSTGTPYVYSPGFMSILQYDGMYWNEIYDEAFLYVPPSQFVVAPSGEIFVSIPPLGEGSATIMRYDGTSWSTLGSCPLPPAHTLVSSKLALDNDGLPWLANLVSNTGGEMTYSVSRYSGADWIPVNETPLPVHPLLSSYLNDQLRVDTGGLAYLRVISADGLSVLRLKNGQWEYLKSGVDAIEVDGNNLVMSVNDDGTPYVAYVDDFSYLAVKKFNGSLWEPVGPVSSDGYMEIDSMVSFPSIAVESSGTIYVTYQKSAGGLGVKKFDGTVWTAVGSYFSGSRPCIKIDSLGVPYVCCSADTTGIKVMRYNGSAWVQIGSVMTDLVAVRTISGGFALAGARFDISGTTPYVFAQDVDSSYRGTVKKFDGSDWVDVGSPGITEGFVEDFGIASATDGTPFVVYATSTTGYSVSVRKFNGTAWTTVGGAVGSSSDNTRTSIAMSGNFPVVVFADSDHGDTLTARRFDGGSWIDVGNAGFSSMPPSSEGTEYAPSISVYNDNVYVSYLNGTPYDLIVMKYGTSTETNFEHSLCVGYSVSLISNQAGEWSSSNPSVASINCAGILTGISAGTATITFTHDSCYSTSVVTVNASPSAGVITGSSIVAPSSSVSLSASISGGVWSSSDTATATITSGGLASGVLTGIVTISYTVTSGSCSSYALHSLVVASARPGNTSVKALDDTLLFSVYPNPTTGAFTLQSGVAGKLTVLSIDGRVVMESKVDAGNTALYMPLGSATGVYVLRFAGDDGAVKTSKLIYNH